MGWNPGPRRRSVNSPPMAIGKEASDRLALVWAPQGALHHVGFVVGSIQETIASFAQSVDGRWDGEIIHDPRQSVRVAFVGGNSALDPLIELVEPDGDSSPVTRFLKRGGGLHHLCYETPDLERQPEE